MQTSKLVLLDVRSYSCTPVTGCLVRAHYFTNVMWLEALGRRHKGYIYVLRQLRLQAVFLRGYPASSPISAHVFHTVIVYIIECLPSANRQPR